MFNFGKKKRERAAQRAAEEATAIEEAAAQAAVTKEELLPSAVNEVVDVPVDDPDNKAVTQDSAELSSVAMMAADIPAAPEPVVQTPETAPEPTPEPALESVPEPALETVPEPEEKSTGGFFSRLKKQLSKTRTGLVEGLGNLIKGKKVIDDELLEEIEMQLLIADVGVEATQSLIASLTDRVSRKQLNDGDALLVALKEDMRALLVGSDEPLVIPKQSTPYVILMVGINGAGKTTTIGKLAKRYQAEGHSVMLAAGDTFRAAAVEQLKVWGERNDIAVVAQPRASDPASVIFDAMSSARARNIDVLIADTAGRLHTQANLMEELKKIVRVINKQDDAAPHEVMLVVDAGIGQNALIQAQQFNKAVGLSGITLTKLDGTAKGGIIFAIAKQLGLPIRYIGVGEGIDDLRVFNGDDFVDALFVSADGTQG